VTIRLQHHQIGGRKWRILPSPGLSTGRRVTDRNVRRAMVHAVNTHGARPRLRVITLSPVLEACSRILVTWDVLDVVSGG